MFQATLLNINEYLVHEILELKILLFFKVKWELSSPTLQGRYGKYYICIFRITKTNVLLPFISNPVLEQLHALLLSL